MVLWAQSKNSDKMTETVTPVHSFGESWHLWCLLQMGQRRRRGDSFFLCSRPSLSSCVSFNLSFLLPILILIGFFPQNLSSDECYTKRTLSFNKMWIAIRIFCRSDFCFVRCTSRIFYRSDFCFTMHLQDILSFKFLPSWLILFRALQNLFQHKVACVGTDRGITGFNFLTANQTCGLITCISVLFVWDWMHDCVMTAF